MLQIELSEAANLVLSSEYRTACDMYERIGVKYSDLLAEDRDSAQEFQERFGYALVMSNAIETQFRFFNNCSVQVDCKMNSE